MIAKYCLQILGINDDGEGRKNGKTAATEVISETILSNFIMLEIKQKNFFCFRMKRFAGQRKIFHPLTIIRTYTF